MIGGLTWKGYHCCFPLIVKGWSTANVFKRATGGFHPHLDASASSLPKSQESQPPVPPPLLVLVLPPSLALASFLACFLGRPGAMCVDHGEPRSLLAMRRRNRRRVRAEVLSGRGKKKRKRQGVSTGRLATLRLNGTRASIFLARGLNQRAQRRELRHSKPGTTRCRQTQNQRRRCSPGLDR